MTLTIYASVTSEEVSKPAVRLLWYYYRMDKEALLITVPVDEEGRVLTIPGFRVYTSPEFGDAHIADKIKRCEIAEQLSFVPVAVDLAVADYIARYIVVDDKS